MTARNWKAVQATSLRHALELDKDFAKERRNLSVERIAEQMGLADHWALYKWFQNGRMPLVLLASYESVCGADYVLRWLAASRGKLLIDVPTGRQVGAVDIQTLQSALNQSVGLLLAFSTGKAEAADTLASIQQAMEGLAWHRSNVEKNRQPELELGISHD
ncbi:hypothetical protein HZU77_013470 [Neisseriaceae bacterium TC5R-5]|nr:hypothetical protein [Neisseriaceae bacterium TC5R-5]